MLFDSIEFAVFLAVVLLVYPLLKTRAQNLFLLLASYFFYGFWNWKFLSLIFVSTLLDFHCSQGIHDSTDPRKRKLLLTLSVVGNLGILGFFKYFNFFIENAEALMQAVGMGGSTWTLSVILPVGISFYTFQTMSYTIDVYRGKIAPTRNLLDFALYVSFFPQLVAGPIERAPNLLPQVSGDRRMTWPLFQEGAWLIFWGLYKKVFIADNLAGIVDPVYSDPAGHSAPMVILATYAFAFQIYADFSGYTDIARGVAKLLGFDLMLNFKLPYFALNPSDFWRRWHISLSQWLRDYLYIPLGGGRATRSIVFRNLMITMALGGLWHGASWNFVLWGVFHGLLLVGYRMAGREHEKASSPTGWRKLWAIFVMFQWTCLGWMLFRIENLTDLWVMLGNLFTQWTWGEDATLALEGLLGYTIVLLGVQLFQYLKDDLMVVTKLPVIARAALYILLYFSLTLGGAFDGRAFIYFQF